MPTKIDFMPSFLFILSAALILFAPDLSFAGTGGTEFATADTRIKDIIEGGGGRVLAGLSFGYAAVRCLHKFDMVHVGTALGVGLMCSVGPAVVESSISGLI